MRAAALFKLIIYMKAERRFSQKSTTRGVGRLKRFLAKLDAPHFKAVFHQSTTSFAAPSTSQPAETSPLMRTQYPFPSWHKS
jgi:hypothetical protein